MIKTLLLAIFLSFIFITSCATTHESNYPMFSDKKHVSKSKNKLWNPSKESKEGLLLYQGIGFVSKENAKIYTNGRCDFYNDSCFVRKDDSEVLIFNFGLKLKLIQNEYFFITADMSLVNVLGATVVINYNEYVYVAGNVKFKFLEGGTRKLIFESLPGVETGLGFKRLHIGYGIYRNYSAGLHSVSIYGDENEYFREISFIPYGFVAFKISNHFYNEYSVYNNKILDENNFEVRFLYKY